MIKKYVPFVFLVFVLIACSTPNEKLAQRENAILKRELEFERKVKATDSTSKKLLEITKIFVKKFANQDASIKEHFNLIMDTSFDPEEKRGREGAMNYLKMAWDNKFDFQVDFNSIHTYKYEDKIFLNVFCKYCGDWGVFGESKKDCGVGVVSFTYNKDGLITNVIFLPLNSIKQ